MTARITASKAQALSAREFNLPQAVELCAAVIAFWPIWWWYCERTLDRSDEPLGIVALITVFALSLGRRSKKTLDPPVRQIPEGPADTSKQKQPTMLVAILLVLLYCCLSFSSPHVVQSIVAVAVVSLCLMRFQATALPLAGEWALLLLSLPIVASLNFYMGYPLRLLASNLASVMLHLGGLAVSAQGAAIFWNDTDVGIDQPCSGIKMLWVALYLTATMASLHRLKLLPTVKILLLAVISAVAANAVRVSSLFYLESGILKIPNPWHGLIHTGIGIVTFGLAAAILVKATSCLSSPDNIVDRLIENSGRNQRVPAKCLIAFTLSCALAAAVPVFHIGRTQYNQPQDFPGWPVQFEGCKLNNEQLSPEIARFADAFPGRIAVFTAGKRRVVIRWVTQPTRQLHSPESCYRASGYEIKWLPEHTDAQGNRWSSFEAAKPSERLLLEDRIFDQSGQSWTDVSAWYWSAVLQKSTGPWWSVCVAERIDAR